MPKALAFITGLVILILLTFNCASAQKGIAANDKISALYDYHEAECIEKGWQKIILNVNGLGRKILWKGPEGRWENGAIIALHGGGGTYSNYCSNSRLCKPMAEFAEMAIEEGFAVFSLDSGYNLMQDEGENPCGKRWDCLAQNRRANNDIDFIQKLIKETIPRLRPPSSSEDVFMTGISNGGFMTILAATHLKTKITAFAPVSAGDPYGTYMDCADRTTVRENAPGRWYDAETHLEISENHSCDNDDYPHEKPWIKSADTNNISFKQFHHEGDAGVDISCMKKTQKLLSQAGYNDDGPYIIKNTGPKNNWKHFWQNQYNKPLIEFFKKSTRKRQEKLQDFQAHVN